MFINDFPLPDAAACPARLLHNVFVQDKHPVAAANGDGPSHSYDYDLFTIGGGSAGVRAARFSAANYGKKVALCELPFGFIASDEEGGLGGTCVLRGCIPKKLLVYGSEFAEAFREAQGYGWNLHGEPTHDWQALRESKNKELQRLSTVYKKNLESGKVDFIEGLGKVVDEHTVEVKGKRYSAQHILVATGGMPTVPPIEGKELTGTSDHILNLKERPNKLVIVGGGYIAAEQCCIYNGFGADVHLFFRGEHMLNGFDMENRLHLEEEFKKQGISLWPTYSPTKASWVTKQSNGKLTVVGKNKDDEEKTVEDVDFVLMATGRKPRTQGLGLEELGVKLDDKGGVKVDDYSQSSVPSIYAIGDVSNRIPLTPVARMEGTYFARHLYGGDPIKPDYDNVASVVFSSPQVAKVGIDEEAAKEKIGDVDIFTTTFTSLKNSLTDNDLKGMMKVVVDAKTDKVLGIHLVGPEVAEILQGFAAAMKAGITKTQLDETVGIHPTAAEELTTLREPSRRIRGGKVQEH
eukprot:jgi/Astpho2/7600/Aster-02504